MHIETTTAPLRLTLDYGNVPISGVYCIRNVFNKKTYVGSAVNLDRRWKQHRRMLNDNKHHSYKLQRAWNKYGKDAFEFFVVSYAHRDRVVEIESQFLADFKCDYNICREARSRAGAKNRAEHNEAIRAAAVARWADPEFKARMKEKLSTTAKRGVDRAKAKYHVTHDDKTLTLREWEELTGIPMATIRYRLRAGQTPAEALDPEQYTNSIARRSKVVGEKAKVNAKQYTFCGQTHTMAEWSKITGVTPKLLHYRLKAGFSEEDIINPVIKATGKGKRSRVR